MPRSTMPSGSRAWPRVAVLALIGVSAAGCADSARFDSNPFASNRQVTPPAEVTGSIGNSGGSSRPMYRTVGVEAQPLPAPSRPATVASNNYGGVSSGAQGLGAYHPSTPSYEPPAPTYQPSAPRYQSSVQ